MARYFRAAEGRRAIPDDELVRWIGGNAAWLAGNDGNRYYYAHMDHWEGSSRGVSQGEVIGYVGDTGNAGPLNYHLHFEVHPKGGAAVNPVPLLTIPKSCTVVP